MKPPKIVTNDDIKQGLIELAVNWPRDLAGRYGKALTKTYHRALRKVRSDYWFLAVQMVIEERTWNEFPNAGIMAEFCNRAAERIQADERSRRPLLPDPADRPLTEDEKRQRRQYVEDLIEKGMPGYKARKRAAQQNKECGGVK